MSMLLWMTVLEVLKVSHTLCCKGLIPSAPNLGLQQMNR